MSNPAGPPQPNSSAAAQPGRPGDDIRIGDAERTEIADRLARHFSDGRLDEAEFGERLDQAMQAKTMADLVRLLADLPSQPAPPQQGDRRHQRKMERTQLERERLALKAERRAHRRAARAVRWRSLRLLILLVGLIIGALIIAHWLAHSVVAWLIIGVVAFFWVRRNAARGGRGPDNSRRD